MHDSQYMPLEKKGSKSGWGHSSCEETLLTAKQANVSRLFLYHHDPTRTDSELLALLSDAKKKFSRVEIAKESQQYEILKGAIHPSNK